ncbi:MAG: DNA-directed RNA polymerase subunit beta [Patescibacteria group bacterium]|nr:DNA-directed RNA polymerase subunit beta [Patescibacteria group bacterium]
MAKDNINHQEDRLYWGKKISDLPQLDLTKTVRDSYEEFLNEGIKYYLDEISPIEDYTGKNWSLSFGSYTFGKPRLTPSQALEKGLTYDMPLKVETRLTNKQTGEITKQQVFLGDIPKMTVVGTFIVNGIERAVVNQIVRSPGVYFTGEVDPITGRTLFMAELRPIRGSWLEFTISRNDLVTVRIDRKRKFPVTTFLRAIGYGSDEEIFRLFSALSEQAQQFIKNTVNKDATKSTSEAVIEIFRKLRPGEPAVLENAQNLIFNMFFNPRRYDLGRPGRYKINKKLNLKSANDQNHWILDKEDIAVTISYLLGLILGKGEVDDIDHLGNRRVRCVGELVGQNAFRVGLLRLERAVREKMSLTPPDTLLTPSQLVNARPVIASINEFFRTSQLSTILDQTNPLAEIDNLRRLTVMGIGGISRERASFSIRDINTSQYGRICPIRSPEGPNIGLVTYMTLYTRVNEYGFLESPYRKVEKLVKNGKTKMKLTNHIEYLMADDEQKHYVTHAGVAVDKEGFLEGERVPVRYNGEFLEAPVEMVEFIDVIPRQVVGTSASLIPFIAHDEANRALMGTHMQCQAVPLLKPSAPIVGTGMENVVAQSMSRVVLNRHEGEVVYVDSRKVIVKVKKGVKLESKENLETIKTEGDKEIYLIDKFKRTSQSVCYSQEPMVKAGQKVKPGDILIDGPASQKGELALGQNLLIAYMSFEGLGYEDAIVISERLIKDDVLSSIHIEEYEAAVVDTKLGPEETTRDIPNVGEEDLANLDENGIVVVGAEVGPNDILVGKISPKGETELSAEERLLRAIFGEKAREVKDTSLRMPHGERGVVVGISVLDRDRGDELEPGTNRLIKVKVAQLRKVVVGDKLAGRHGNKGVISKIIPEADMPHLSDGTPIDVIISPLSVLARMNLGQLLEAHLGWGLTKLGQKVAVPVFENISEDRIKEVLNKAGLPMEGKTVLFDGRTGEAFKEPVVVGTAYIMKLIHMVEDKTHARSTGPYSLVTQQPLGGKAQMGGQRLGEMEVWALEAHRAAYTLQEMLTIKSDDVVGRAKTFEAIVKGTEIPAAKIPESFKVLIKELNSLGLKIDPLEAVKATFVQADSGSNPLSSLAPAATTAQPAAAKSNDDKKDPNDSNDSNSETKTKEEKT